MAHLVEYGFEVYKSICDNARIDLIALREDLTLKISCKATTASNKDSWTVGLRTVSRRKDNKLATSYFDNSKIDILAVYIQPLNKVVLIDAKKITAKHEVQFSLNRYDFFWMDTQEDKGAHC